MDAFLQNTEIDIYIFSSLLFSVLFFLSFIISFSGGTVENFKYMFPWNDANYHTFLTGGGNKYSERVCKLLSGDDGIGSVVDTLAPALIEYLTAMTRLPWGAEIPPDSAEHILRFALLAMEVREQTTYLEEGFCFIFL